MARNNWEIKLATEDRKTLEKYVSTGTKSVKLVNRAKIILASDKSTGLIPMKEEKIAENIGVSKQTVHNTKVDFHHADNLDAFLKRKVRETPPVAPKVTGDVEAHIVALACSTSPVGHSKWSLRLIADRCVELNYIDEISHTTISRVLKKHNSSLI